MLEVTLVPLAAQVVNERKSNTKHKKRHNNEVKKYERVATHRYA